MSLPPPPPPAGPPKSKMPMPGSGGGAPPPPRSTAAGAPPLAGGGGSKFPPPPLRAGGGTPTAAQPLRPSPMNPNSAPAAAGGNQWSPSPVRPPTAGAGTGAPNFPSPSPMNPALAGAKAKFPPPPSSSAQARPAGTPTTTTAAAAPGSKQPPPPPLSSSQQQQQQQQPPKQPPPPSSQSLQKRPPPSTQQMSSTNAQRPTQQTQPPQQRPSQQQQQQNPKQPQQQRQHDPMLNPTGPMVPTVQNTTSPTAAAKILSPNKAMSTGSRDSSLSRSDFAASSTLDQDQFSLSADTSKLPPLCLLCPVSICVGASGQVISVSNKSKSITSESLYSVLSSTSRSEGGATDVGHRYAAAARDVPPALDPSSTKPDAVANGVRELAGEDSPLCGLIQHLVSTQTANPEWSTEIVATLVPLLDRFGANTELDVPLKNTTTTTTNNIRNDTADNDAAELQRFREEKRRREAAALEVQALTISGDRAGAVQAALDAGLYAEALLTSMLCEKELYLKAVQSFLDSSISRSSPLGQAFLLFNDLPLATAEQVVAGVPHFQREWAHHMKMLLCNYSAAGLADGVNNWSDALLQAGMVDEAHFCLMLLQASPAWAVANGPVSDALRSKMVLVGGSYRRQSCRAAYLSFRSLFLSDAGLEFSKQRFNEKFVRGALVPFKLAHALLHQELGLLEKATTYADFVAKLLLAGGHKCKVERLSSSALPTSLTHLAELVRYGIAQHKSAILSVNRTPAATASASGGTASGSGGILSWFGFGGGGGGGKKEPSPSSSPSSSAAASKTQQQPSTSAEKPTAGGGGAPPLSPNSLSATSGASASSSSSSLVPPANAASMAPPSRAQSAPAPSAADQQQQQPDNGNNKASSQARSPSIASRVGGALGGAIGGTLGAIGGIFKRSRSQSAAGTAAAAGEDGKPPPPNAHLDSGPPLEWDSVNNCYKIQKTEEQKRIEAMTKAGPPKKQLPPASPNASNATSSGGSAPATPAAANNDQQPPAVAGGPRTTPLGPQGPARQGMGGKLPPPGPVRSQFSAQGRSRYGASGFE